MVFNVRLVLAVVSDALSELGWLLYGTLFRPISVGWMVRRFKLSYEAYMVIFTIAGIAFMVAAVALLFYLMFFHEWNISLLTAIVALATLWGWFYWKDKRRDEAERRWTEKHISPS